MGINSFLPCLKNATRPVGFGDLSGKILAVDGFSWLHKSVFTCPEELSLGKPTDNYINFLEKRIGILQSFGIQIFMVFDGNSLEAKKGTNDKRRVERLNNRIKAEQYKKANQHFKARDHYARSASVTPEMCKSWINVCKNYKIPYIVAPFEADSQMVYLEKQGIVDGIISEDSDLIIFGCERLYTKMDFDRATCQLVDRSQFHRLKEDVNAKGIPKLDIENFSQVELIKLVCLSGCDYTPGLYQIGLIKAYNLLREFEFDVELILKAVETEYFKKKANKPTLVNPIPEGYLEDYYRALACFQYMFVFDPIKEKMMTLNELPEDADISLFKYLGSVAKTDSTISFLNNLEEIDHDMQKLFSLGELRYKYLVKWTDREFAIRNNIVTDELLEVTEFNKENIMNLFKNQEIKVILPNRKISFKRSVTEPVGVSLEAKVEKRRLLSTAVVKSTSYSQSKYFGSKFQQIVAVNDQTEAVVQRELVKENEADFIESLDSGVHEISLNNHPNHMIVDFSEKKSEQLNPVMESDLEVFDDDQDDIINATIQHKSEILEEIGSYVFKPEQYKDILSSPVRPRVSTQEKPGEIIQSPAKTSAIIDSEIMFNNSSPVKKKQKGNREELIDRVNKLGQFLGKTRSFSSQENNFSKRSFSTQLSSAESAEKDSLSKTHDLIMQDKPSLKREVIKTESYSIPELIKSVNTEDDANEQQNPETFKSNSKKIKTITFPTGTITIFGKK